MNDNKKPGIRDFISLHLVFLLYSAGSIFSKFASREEFLSFRFILFYGAVILILLVYAVLWQQMLKKIKLTVAFANKAVTVIWGILWGALLFQETVTLPMIIGALVIIVGIILVVTGDG